MTDLEALKQQLVVVVVGGGADLGVLVEQLKHPLEEVRQETPERGQRQTHDVTEHAQCRRAELKHQCHKIQTVVGNTSAA